MEPFINPLSVLTDYMRKGADAVFYAEVKDDYARLFDAEKSEIVAVPFQFAFSFVKEWFLQIKPGFFVNPVHISAIHTQTRIVELDNQIELSYEDTFDFEFESFLKKIYLY